MFVYTSFIRLRESFGVPFPLRGGLHVIRLPCTRWDVSETCLNMFLPNQPKPAAGRPRNRKVHQPGPQGELRMLPQYRIQESTSRTATCILVHRQPYNESACPHCFPKETREASERDISCVRLGQCSLQWGWFKERVADPTECTHSLVPSSFFYQTKVPWCTDYKAEASCGILRDTWESPPSAKSCTRTVLWLGSHWVSLRTHRGIQAVGTHMEPSMRVLAVGSGNPLAPPA